MQCVQNVFWKQLIQVFRTLTYNDGYLNVVYVDEWQPNGLGQWTDSDLVPLATD